MPELQNPITHPALAPIGLEMAREMVLEKDEEIRKLQHRLDAAYRGIDKLSARITALDRLADDVMNGIVDAIIDKKEAECGTQSPKQ